MKRSGRCHSAHTRSTPFHLFWSPVRHSITSITSCHLPAHNGTKVLRVQAKLIVSLPGLKLLIRMCVFGAGGRALGLESGLPKVPQICFPAILVSG